MRYAAWAKRASWLRSTQQSAGSTLAGQTVPRVEKGFAMNMTEVARLLLGLRAAGWSEKEINDFILFIETGEEQYKPKPKLEDR